MAEILEISRAALPQWMADYPPSGADAVRADVGRRLREHASELQRMGRHTGHVLVHVLLGMVIGAMVSMCCAFADREAGPLARALKERVV